MGWGLGVGEDVGIGVRTGARADQVVVVVVAVAVVAVAQVEESLGEQQRKLKLMIGKAGDLRCSSRSLRNAPGGCQLRRQTRVPSNAATSWRSESDCSPK